MGICILKYQHTYICTSTKINIYTNKHINTKTLMWKYIHTHTITHIYIQNVYIHMCTHIHTHSHKCIYIYISEACPGSYKGGGYTNINQNFDFLN